ncbi:tellurite resistance TerB family protein [Litoreibacter roseus]|uniref:Uncharacterized protein n=1 Tax=Litoreibacter roseus TaxID=2601869 RepID=A0A6N6JEP7_9RHOB|nr:tellurite resistance TerB family protein [Litoreibacter roseus]GFE63692.1 hypothetical protein KIN_07660 [Litoreibacter roseus]
MSLMKMVTKVAVGFAVAKGLQKVQQSGGIGKMMDGLKGGAAQGQGTAQVGSAQSGGLGGLLGQLSSGSGGGAAAGGLGGIGGLLGGLAAAKNGQPAGSSLEELLSQDNPPEEPPQEETAGLMIRAMIMAARSDGKIDANEKETLMATIGDDATAEDMEFVRAAMQEDVDANKIASETPNGMETQVYSMSVMAIEPDHPAEAKYLHELATALGIGQATVNEIHDSFGVQRLYS